MQLGALRHARGSSSKAEGLSRPQYFAACPNSGRLTAEYSCGSGIRWEVDIVDNVGTRPESVVNRRGKVVRGSCETG